jgi:hypothetical protein
VLAAFVVAVIKHDNKVNHTAPVRVSVDSNTVTCGEALPRTTTERSHAILLALEEKLGPEVNDGAHSEKQAREAVAGMIVLNCALASPATKPINEGFLQQTRTFLSTGK